MVQKWVMGVAGVIALLAVSGVGFAAFSATATVNGNVYAGTVGLQIVDTWATNGGSVGYYVGCVDNFTGTVPYVPVPDNVSFGPVTNGGTQVQLTATNMTPSEDCEVAIELQNTGSVPEVVSVAVQTPGANGLCTPGALNCYDVATMSGISAQGWLVWACGPPCGSPHSVTSVTAFTTLNPGGTYIDVIEVDIPPGSGDLTPASGSFALQYTATAGI
jgi:hypothetical protein